MTEVCSGGGGTVGEGVCVCSQSCYLFHLEDFFFFFFFFPHVKDIVGLVSIILVVGVAAHWLKKPK